MKVHELTPIKQANFVLCRRYIDIISEEVGDAIEADVVDETMEKLLDMCIYMCNNADTMYEDKMSRWLGFVQGVLYSRMLIDINEEREFSRPLFHEAYDKMGLEKPETVTI